jgi:8-oxo-dGTP diphosphatase
MMNYVLGFMFRKNNTEVALIEKLKPEWQKGKLNGIGGKLEKDEDMYRAIEREFKEETGAIVTTWKRFCTIGDSKNNWNVECFTTNDKENGDIEIKSVELEQVEWHKVEEINKINIIPNLKWLIPLALDKDDLYADVIDDSIF